MAESLYLALLVFVMLAGPAADQTAASTSGVAGTTPANRIGAVTLPGTTVTPSTAAT